MWCTRHTMTLSPKPETLPPLSLSTSSLPSTLLTPGYQRLKQNVTLGKADHHEGLDMYAPSPYPPPAEGTKPTPLAGENQWPAQPERMRPVLEAWIGKMKGLGGAVMRAMADGLGMTTDEKEALLKDCDEGFWSMRVIGAFGGERRGR